MCVFIDYVKKINLLSLSKLLVAYLDQVFLNIQKLFFYNG